MCPGGKEAGTGLASLSHELHIGSSCSLQACVPPEAFPPEGRAAPHLDSVLEQEVSGRKCSARFSWQIGECLHQGGS